MSLNYYRDRLIYQVQKNIYRKFLESGDLGGKSLDVS